MKSNFNDCLNRVLKDEGGYSNDPSDSGGATNFGITIDDYRKYIKATGTPEDVRNMKLADAKRIYKSKYWDALGCDNLSSGLDYTVFDYGVNSGLGRPRTALGKFPDIKGIQLITAINNERMGFLESLATNRPKDKKFLKGWLARVKRVQNYSVYLASHSPDKSGAAVGTGMAAVFAAMSQYFHQHEYLIIGGGLALAILAGAAIHIYRNK